MFRFLILLFCVAQSFAQTTYGSECTTNTNNLGKCVPIQSCRSNFNSDCGNIDGVDHVCCAKDDVQLNPASLELLPHATCGIFRVPKVAGGKDASLFSFPWMALLKYKGNEFKCGGTLINNRYILTAAHCVNNEYDTPMEVRLGEHKISTVVDCAKAGRKTRCAGPVQDIGIEKIVYHPHYRRLTLYNDIALIRLNRTVEFKKHIRPICLPVTPSLMSQRFDEYIIAGWGLTEHKTPSDVLQWTTLYYRNLDICNSFYKVQFLEEQMCISDEHFRESCEGDSGGPLKQLSTYNGHSRMIQFGIVSGGLSSCGEGNPPGVYTNVQHYMQWITDHMRS